MNHYRHFDFQRIYDEFVNYYKDQSKGDGEYYSWIHALQLDESKPYGSARESFKWAANMLRLLREDADAKYYGVIVGLPWRSMNGNVYRERDLIAAALSLKGKSPSVNHKDEYWLSPKNPANRWGTVTVEDAKYEDGAVEAILRVPKEATCPVCPNPRSRLTDLIDNQHIVNVSLEGTMNGAFEFTDPPFTLLTSDVLPGIPLARIKPLEKIMVEALQVSTGKKQIVTIKARVKESDYTLTQQPVDVDRDSKLNPDFKGATPEGMIKADSQIDTQSDQAKTVLGGSVPDNIAMTSGAAYAASTHLPIAPAKKEAVAEPFSGYKDFADCVAKNSDKTDPEGFCGAMKAKTESAAPTEPLDTPGGGSSAPSYPESPVGPSRTAAPSRSAPDAGSMPPLTQPQTVTGTSPGSVSVVMGNAPFEQLISEQVARIKAETREVTAKAESAKLKDDMEKVEAIWTQKYAQLSELYRKQEVTLQSQEQIMREQRNAIAAEQQRMESLRKEHRDELAKEQQRSEDLRVEIRDVKNQFADATSISNKQAKLVEDLKLENESLTKKYGNALQNNLELSQKLTKANEEYLEIAKQKENVEDALGRARNEAKRIAKITV